jgi:hypothetical protein
MAEGCANQRCLHELSCTRMADTDLLASLCERRALKHCARDFEVAP